MVKEMDGTDEFLLLDEKARKCGIKESLLECQARLYLWKGVEECGCVPYAIKNYSQPGELGQVNNQSSPK